MLPALFLETLETLRSEVGWPSDEQVTMRIPSALTIDDEWPLHPTVELPTSSEASGKPAFMGSHRFGLC